MYFYKNQQQISFLNIEEKMYTGTKISNYLFHPLPQNTYFSIIRRANFAPMTNENLHALTQFHILVTFLKQTQKL